MKNRKSTPYFFAALLVAVIGFIWGNSLLDANRSGSLSGWFTSLSRTLFPSLSLHMSEGVVRKIAHAVEFCILGVLITTVLYVKLRKALSLTLLSGLSVALIDETIQLFSSGRSAMIQDIWLDFAGFILGFLIVFVIHRLSGRKKRA